MNKPKIIEILFHAIPNRAAHHHFLYRLDIRTHHSVDIPGGDLRPDQLPDRLERFGGFQRSVQVERLASGKNLNRNNRLNMINNFQRLSSRKPSHANVVFLRQGGANTINANRVAQHLILAHQCCRRAVCNHKSGIESPVLHQKRWQCRQARVAHALDSTLAN